MSRPARNDVSRTHIASVAARLMAEDGLGDMALAKRKAARQLGLPESARLPDDAEVESELRLYLALYQGEAQPERLRRLREAAVRAMTLLRPFRPYLTGAVLDGTAGEFSAIDLMLFADSAKDVEIFLLDHALSFVSGELRNERAEARLQLSLPEADVNLFVFPARTERQHFRRRDGRIQERLPLEGVQRLLTVET
ncbi:MAG: hypothetical protein LBB55_05530 [Zoogloeaceae bacterium]|jgi:hypothetical protein|nr:hypothetical protein [Zoogloeaceae bacterium]